MGWLRPRARWLWKKPWFVEVRIRPIQRRMT
jgi:hypothetical protein